MTLRAETIRRGILASPFLLIAVVFFTLMDPGKMELHWTPFLQAGKIAWDDGSIPILSTFYHNKYLDDTWRPFTVLFSPAALGYDPVAWWLGFSFLSSIGPLHAIWFLESHRPTNKGTPAYLPAVFTVLGQFIGAGAAAPLFYFLCLTFGPVPSRRSCTPVGRTASFVLPLLLLFHMLESFAAFLASDLETRHWFTWTWQSLPLCVGIGDALLSRAFPAITTADPPSAKRLVWSSVEVQLGVLTLIAAAVWAYVLGRAPYSLSTIFLPAKLVQDDFESHARLVLQLDHLCTFGASLLWMAYCYVDSYRAGLLLGRDCFLFAALLPVIVVCAGPATGVAFAWYWREKRMCKERK